MDKVEAAARIVVRAYGFGRSWDAKYSTGAEVWRPSEVEETPEIALGGMLEDGEPVAVSDGVPVCRETETLQRAGESVSGWLGRPGAQWLTPEQRKARACLTEVQCQALWAWERAHPLHQGQDKSPYRTRELEHWKRTRAGLGVQVIRPLHAMDQCALEALAGIPKPIQATLLVYALQDERYWPTVERFARAVLPEAAHPGIAEGMYRLLKEPSMRERAKELHMRVTNWDSMSRPALRLFERWLERAASQFLQQLERQPRPVGRQASGHRSETWWRPPPCP